MKDSTRYELESVVQLFDDTAFQVRKLARESISYGNDYIYPLKLYRVQGKSKLLSAFPRDVCFEIANQLEEFARLLEWFARRPNRDS